MRFNNEVSEILTLIGGGPQGTLLGGLEYIVQSDDNSDCVDSKGRFKYIDDLSILQLIFLSGLLVEYNFMEHVPSDIGTDGKYLPPESFETQNHLNYISNLWNLSRNTKLISYRKKVKILNEYCKKL